MFFMVVFIFYVCSFYTHETSSGGGFDFPESYASFIIYIGLYFLGFVFFDFYIWCVKALGGGENKFFKFLFAIWSIALFLDFSIEKSTIFYISTSVYIFILVFFYQSFSTTLSRYIHLDYDRKKSLVKEIPPCSQLDLKDLEIFLIAIFFLPPFIWMSGI